MLVRVVLRPVVAGAGEVVGQVQQAPRQVGEVRLGRMRDEAVEEDRISRRGWYRLQRQSGFVQRVPFLTDQTLAVPARHYFQAAVFQRRGIDRDQCRDEQRSVTSPAGLLVLMGLEAWA